MTDIINIQRKGTYSFTIGVILQDPNYCLDLI